MGRKAPEERGHPAAAWIVLARVRLGLSDRQVVDMLGRYSVATLRKAEAHSRSLSRPLWEALVPLYQRLADEQGVKLPTPPDFHTRAESASDMATLIELVREQTSALRELWSVLREVADEMRQARQEAPDWALAAMQAARAVGTTTPEDGASSTQRSSSTPRRGRA